MRALFALALVPLMATTGCHASWEKEGKAVPPSGTGVSRSFAASGFTKVDLRGPDDVDVKNGAQFAVTAEGDAATLDKLEIQVVDGTLRVGRKDQHGWSSSSDRGVKVHVTLPTLNGATIGGSGDLSVDKAQGDFSGAVAGSGNLSIAALTASNADLSIAGSGDIKVAGSGGALKVSIAGSGDVDASKYSAAGGSVSIAGSGSLNGVMKGDVSVSLIGSGDVTLTGGAKCAVTSLGSGEAHCS
ncbi:head GIN domain-containing protein [Sphingomonas sp. KR3-1]|uniref:head GIN domain-containing protein n=1 Tax=Sphingomonas sp. KR3-1 TaxID=3156611 RepID=UPI0032B3D1AD